MHNVIPILTFLTINIGVMGGLSAAATIPIFLLTSLYLIKDSIRFECKNIKLELVFFIWLFISSFWSADIYKSLTAFSIVLILFFTTYLLINNINILSTKFSLTNNTLIIILTMAMIIFLFEFLSDGYINSLFRREIQQKDSHEFYLHYLNRGCSLLSLFAWFVLAALLRKKKYVLSALIYIVLLFVFAISDSLASFVGFIAAGLVFIATRYSFLSNPKLISVVLIISSLAFISLTFLMDPYKTSNQNSFLPCSAKHRLFIWSFTAGKIAEKPIAGWGHGSSRMFQIPENNIITYEGYTFHPLPIHPHNNLSQILLENGIIGLFLYGALIIKYIFAWHKYTKSKSSALLNIRSAGYAFFVSFFVISLIAFNMWQSWWLCSYLWVALLFCNIATKEKSSIE